MIARVATFEGTPDQLREAARLMRDEVDPTNAQRTGFVQSLFLTDSEAGSALLIAVWEDEQAIELAEQEAQTEQRQGALEMTGGRRTGVKAYEVATFVHGSGPTG